MVPFRVLRTTMHAAPRTCNTTVEAMAVERKKPNKENDWYQSERAREEFGCVRNPSSEGAYAT